MTGRRHDEPVGPDGLDAGADRQRFEAMFRAHYAALTRYAVRRVGPDAATDVVSETFLTAWRRLDTVPDNALPWLYAAARRVVANEVRRRERHQRLGERVAAEREELVDDPADALSDRLRVRAALAALSERDREVVRLIEWERLDAATAACVLGCSASAVKVRLHRARRRLAAHLGGNDAGRAELLTHGGTS